MRRREFITAVGGAAVLPFTVRAQQPSKIARVGLLRQTEPIEKHLNAFRSGLRAAGYVEGQNLTIDQRYAAGAYDKLGELVADCYASTPMP
jgi:putative ABC transport system substrate-binding protein